jgi:ketosteroid isomerase-like protein
LVVAQNSRRRTLQRALEACIRGDADALPELFTEDVSGWSPNLMVGSLGELADAVADRDDALSNVDITIDAVDVVGNKGFAEYRVSAVFSGPFVIQRGVVVEPNGHDILLGAAMVAEFSGDRIAAFRNYFDDATLLEQMLAPA